MIDRENVFKGLECCKWSRQNVRPEKKKCDECPYKDKNIMNAFTVWQSCTNVLAGEVLAVLKEQESMIEALKSDLSETLQVLSEQPTIVLCKDCKHFNDMKCSYPERGTCNLWHTLHWGDWFCADGERKDNG